MYPDSGYLNPRQDAAGTERTRLEPETGIALQCGMEAQRLVCQGRAEATVKMRREHQAAARLFGNFFVSYSLVWFIGFILWVFFFFISN